MNTVIMLRQYRLDKNYICETDLMFTFRAHARAILAVVRTYVHAIIDKRRLSMMQYSMKLEGKGPRE